MAWPQQVSYNMPLKVHINPNFRGKTSFSGAQGNGERPVGIHFNPHWKPKTEVLDAINPTAIEDAFKLDLTSNQKRTIHINPKIIPNGVPPSISTLLHQDYLSTNMVSMRDAARDGVVEEKSTLYHRPSKEKTAITTKLNQKTIEGNSCTKTNGMVDSPAQLNKFRKNINSANSPTIRTAKVVRSKYKYLNNTVAHHLVPQSLLKRQNYPSSMTKTSTSNSRFKYIKKSEDLPDVRTSGALYKTHVVSRFKLVNGIAAARNEVKLTSAALTPRHIKAQKILENVKNIPEHTLKSRYKLSKGSETTPRPICGFKNRSLMNAQKSKTTCRYKFVRSSASSQRTPLNRKSPRALKSRFKFIRGTGTQPTRSTPYRLICNRNATPNYKQKGYQPFSPLGRRNRWVNSRLNLQATKVVTTNKKLLRIGRRPETRPKKSDKVRKAKLLNIGGVFYRSTRTTLTRSSGATASTSKGEKKSYPVKGQVLSIRGSKFLLDNTGRTLQRLTPNKIAISRIHIGGVTFVQSSENILVRSRVHEARNLVSQAKQRSIAVLTSKLRKNNQPCLIYQRLGKCRLHNKGCCPKVHDPKKIAICNDFVNGKCLKSGAECRLSHDVGPEKMPTCHFFLEGCCVRDPCPYSHVKLNKKAAICRDFLSGYCSAGDKCKKRHVFLCPEYDLTKCCSKGKYCTYRHAGDGQPKTAHSHGDVSAPNNPEGSTTSSKEIADALTRYYVKNVGAGLADKKECGSHSGNLKSETCLTSNEELVILCPERSKLGDLPGFIPL